MRIFGPLVITACVLANPLTAAPLPGAPAFDTATETRLASATAVSPPRTRYRDASGAPIYTNRLVFARSPYLRQHAHNPVNWQPWGDNAFAEARARDVPIFLSVGYATCHWCHVMEEESFDHTDIAEVLNAHYVAVKVDRETLPQIDAQYMLATQILIGRGGWPNNVFLTPDGQPIVAMGYAPPDSFRETLVGLASDWRQPDGREAMESQAASVSDFVRLVSSARQTAATVDETAFQVATEKLLADHDDFLGGFGKGPKFPNESNLRFLLDRYERSGDEASFNTALTSLRAIAAGGIHDHVGGGFHRYAVDGNWRTPHFEKMLYNQALLSRNFLQAYRLTHDPVFERAARRALDYVLRDMTTPEGAFYAAQDADSATPEGEVEEGAYYTWTHDQLAVAGALSIQAAIGLDQAPTVPSGSVAHFDPQTTHDFAALDPMLEQMRLARSNRPPPLTDTKIIAGWNGLMIRALVDGATTLKDARYLAAAERAAGFTLNRLRAPDGNLSRAWVDGPLGEGSLRDFAWMGLAAVALYDATDKVSYLHAAQQLSSEITRRFSDGADKPYRLAQKSGPLGPSYDVIEGATPTGNAAALELFALLARRGSDDRLAVASRNHADSLLAALSGTIVEAPEANISTLTAAAIHMKSETGSSRRMGNGMGTAETSVQENMITVDLAFQPGWHANAAQPLDPDLIPTRLKGDGVTNVTYPQPKMVTLGFQNEPLAVLEGKVRIAAQRMPQAREAELTIQLCNDDRCLPPEMHRFRLPQK